LNVKNGVRKLINSFGYDIRSLKQVRTTIGESYSLLCRLGFQPTTVVDVGVASGTLELYEAFQNHIFYFIEPLKEFETDLISIIQRYKGSYVQAVAGSSSGHVTFNVHDHN